MQVREAALQHRLEHLPLQLLYGEHHPEDDQRGGEAVADERDGDGEEAGHHGAGVGDEPADEDQRGQRHGEGNPHEPEADADPEGVDQGDQRGHPYVEDHAVVRAAPGVVHDLPGVRAPRPQRERPQLRTGLHEHDEQDKRDDESHQERTDRAERRQGTGHHLRLIAPQPLLRPPDQFSADRHRCVGEPLLQLGEALRHPPPQFVEVVQHGEHHEGDQSAREDQPDDQRAHHREGAGPAVPGQPAHQRFQHRGQQQGHEQRDHDVAEVPHRVGQRPEGADDEQQVGRHDGRAAQRGGGESHGRFGHPAPPAPTRPRPVPSRTVHGH